MKALFAEAELLQDIGVLRQVVLLEVIEKLAAAGSHLEKSAAGVEVLPMRAQMLGQMIDPGGQQRDLDLARAGVLLVGFELGDDFWFYDCRHGLVFELHDCRGLLGSPVPPASAPKFGVSAGDTVPIPRDAGPVMVEVHNRWTFTNAR